MWVYHTNKNGLGKKKERYRMNYCITCPFPTQPKEEQRQTHQLGPPELFITLCLIHIFIARSHRGRGSHDLIFQLLCVESSNWWYIVNVSQLAFADKSCDTLKSDKVKVTFTQFMYFQLPFCSHFPPLVPFPIRPLVSFLNSLCLSLILIKQEKTYESAYIYPGLYSNGERRITLQK